MTTTHKLSSSKADRRAKRISSLKQTADGAYKFCKSCWADFDVSQDPTDEAYAVIATTLWETADERYMYAVQST